MFRQLVRRSSVNYGSFGPVSEAGSIRGLASLRIIRQADREGGHETLNRILMRMDANKEFEFVCFGSLPAVALSIVAFFGSGDCPDKATDRDRPRPALQGHRTISARRGFRIALPIPGELAAICHMGEARPGTASCCLRYSDGDTPVYRLKSRLKKNGSL